MEKLYTKKEAEKEWFEWYLYGSWTGFIAWAIITYLIFF